MSLLIPLALATGPKPIMQCDACKRHFTKPHYLFVHKQLHEFGAGMGELKVSDLNLIKFSKAANCMGI